MAKKVDDNGYLTYEDVLISREGVFDYAGFQIDPEGAKLEPRKVYKVYRPKSEVCKKSFVDSLENKPLVDDHTMLGNYGKPAEKKGVHGVLTNVKVVGNELHGTITVWSETMKEKIRSGKKELSLGYTGYFRPQSGRYNGQHYDFIQFGLSANHIALVDDARMGHSCKLMDSAVLVCDSMELPKMPNDTKEKSCCDEIIEKLKGCSDEDIAKVKDYLAGLSEKKPGGDTKPEEKEQKANEKKPDVKDEKTEKKVEEQKPDAKPEVKDQKPAGDAPDAKPAAEVTDEDKAKAEAEKKAAEEKAAADKKACEDAAIASFRKAEALAKRCEPLFGNIVMDGLRTEKDVAVKVCAMDSALKFVDAEKALDALSVRLDEFEKNHHGDKVTVTDAKVSVAFDFMSAFQSRK